LIAVIDKAADSAWQNFRLYVKRIEYLLLVDAFVDTGITACNRKFYFSGDTRNCLLCPAVFPRAQIFLYFSTKLFYRLLQPSVVIS
jgi:hypothetical protein